MSLHSWGNYPKIENNTLNFDDHEHLRSIVSEHLELIPHGNGRSYGDSALSRNIINVRPHNLVLNFDKNSGLLHVEAGIILSEILDSFVPKGWFLRITPGTKLITVGGAIASDVHGKNHHVDGCFSESVTMLKLMLPDGEIVNCSRNENSELFKATCGGMGLTGIILEAQITLMSISSARICQTIVKTRSLKETFDAFDEYKDKAYVVGWTDCLANKKGLGRSLLTVGDFDNDGSLGYRGKRNLNIPFNLPSFVLNRWSAKSFNSLYYGKVRDRESTKSVGIDTFFYPLDAIGNWNRIYGKKGFTQYQFVLPKDTSYTGLAEVLNSISRSGLGSYLAVLKLFGAANSNYLSFPMEGYTLALDFKIQSGLFAFLNELDRLVLKFGGRIYLTKDARVSKDVFELGYPKVEKFRALRKKYKMDEKFNSLQSRRVGI